MIYNKLFISQLFYASLYRIVNHKLQLSKGIGIRKLNPK